MASSLGINVAWTKIVAFGLSGAIAGVGGVLLAYRTTTMTFEGFNPFASASVVTWATIGGVGLLAGPIFGYFLAPDSLGETLGHLIYDNTQVLGFVGGDSF